MNVLFFVLYSMMSLAPGRDHSEVATAITAAVLDEPPLWDDDDERMRTAATLVAVTFRESSFRQSAKSKTNDHCVAQIHGRPDLAKDLDKCVRTAMAMLRQSIGACGESNHLGVYATGTCTSEHGKRISRDRMWLSKKILREAP